MDPLTIGLITGGANLLGSIFSSNTSAENTQAQIAASQQQQATQNAFSQQMSSTAYQRASQDMQKAGLNPAMMFGSGGPASSPSGSGIQAPMPQRTSPLGALGDSVRNAMSTAVQAKEMDKMSEVTANVDLQNQELRRQLAAGKPETDVERTRASTGLEMARANMTDQLRTMNIPEEQKAKIWDSMPDLVKKGQVWSDVAGNVAGNAGRVVKDLYSGVRGLIPNSAETAAKRLSPNQRQEVKDLFSDRFNAAYGNTQ